MITYSLPKAKKDDEFNCQNLCCCIVLVEKHMSLVEVGTQRSVDILVTLILVIENIHRFLTTITVSFELYTLFNDPVPCFNTTTTFATDLRPYTA